MRTAYRQSARAKRAEPSKFWRRSVTAEQVRDCQLVHWDLFDKFTKGRPTETDVVDMLETGLTYSELMRLLEADGLEITEEAKAAIGEHLEACAGVAERFRTTGRVGFNSEQLLAARAACEVMDQLIEMDRFGFAERAARWSTQQVLQMQAA